MTELLFAAIGLAHLFWPGAVSQLHAALSTRMRGRTKEPLEPVIVQIAGVLYLVAAWASWGNR